MGLFALSTGCSVRKGLPDEYRHQTAHGEVYIDVPQEEINPSIRRSNMSTYSGGGLIFALADAVVDDIETGNAEDNVAQLRNKLINYSFEANFIRLLQQKLAEAGQLRDDQILEVPTADKKFVQNTLETANKPLAVLSSSYVLAPDFDGLVIRATLQLFVKEASTSKPVYKNVFLYWHDFPGYGDNAESNLASLNADPSIITNSLNAGQRAIIDMMVYDIRQPEELEGAEMLIGDSKTLTTGFDANTRYSSGKLITNLDGIDWYRLSNDSIYGHAKGY